MSIIAIDGPAGSGKSTIARKVARQLGYRYVDTGAMYRAVAWWCREAGYSPGESRQFLELLPSLDLSIFPQGEAMGIRVNGRDVSGDIRSEEISALSSAIAAIPEVRQQLVDLYRRAGAGGCAVIEGRDIGTVAFPDAGLKIFLTASPEARAGRRCLEVRGSSITEVTEALRRRDERDSGRDHAPLQQAADAVVIDTTAMSVDEVCAEVVRLACHRFPDLREHVPCQD